MCCNPGDFIEWFPHFFLRRAIFLNGFLTFVCVRACVRVCVRACVRVCVCNCPLLGMHV